MKLLEMMLQMLPQKWFGSKQVSCCNDQVEILIIGFRSPRKLSGSYKQVK